MVKQPPAKRMKLDVPPAGVGGGGGAASPTSRRLRQTLLVVLFLVRASARTTVTASISQLGGMLQRYVDRAFHKYHGMISSKLDSFQGQLEGLRHEVTQISRLCSTRHADQQTRLEANHEHVPANESNTNTRLCFMNNLRQRVYTDKYITDDNNAAIKVAVFEGDKMITTGPLSKAKIEILVLRGNFYDKCRDSWTEEEFDKHIVQDQNEKALVLGTAWLNNGEVELKKIRFKEGSNREKFIVGARVSKSKYTHGRIREAIMEPVTVMVGRNEPNEKSYPPRLYDHVYRLEEIARDGAYHKRLQEANICTVEGFLKALNKDSDELCNILQMKKKRKSWLKMTGHARTRILEDRRELKTYLAEDGNVVLFFNCVHDLVGARFYGDYVAFEKFDMSQKALVNKLKEHAYNILERIPSNYVMKGNAPEQISPGSTGPSVVPGKPNSFAENPEASQAHHGTVEARNWPPGGIDVVGQPIHSHANYGPLNTYDWQGQRIPPHIQQQLSLPSIRPEWQENPQGPADSHDLSELMSMDMLQGTSGSGTSTSAQPNFVPHQLPQPYQMVAAATPGWTMMEAVDPLSFPEQDQGPNCQGKDW
ncbi:unnamed protein product [Urochloa decumbens]|uniref:Calmodulin-binding protein n=2 Tax=Urochloa decumbens TaxID=240449 RepID=A0ABC8VXX4_9POAL